MSGVSSDLESLFADFVAAHVLDGRRLAAEELCGARPHLIDPLNDLINRYLSITTALDDAESAEPDREAGSGSPLPRFEGFHTIERLGVGGMGEVFKLRDLSLDRVVAAKVMRRDSRASGDAAALLQEARALALFADRRIVRIVEVRPAADPPAIIMEFVEGFELGRIGPSLEFGQRARLMIEICEAIQHAHALGLQHRDLKPSNIMVDAQLGRPRLALRRTESRRAPTVSPRPQGRRGRLLPRRGGIAATPARDSVSRNRFPRRRARHARTVVR
jgi:hypothetical protein